MNSLQDLRTFFKNLGKEVTEYTGHSMTADGFNWGIVHDTPWRDHVPMSPMDWKAYVKALKAGQPAPVLTPRLDTSAIADSLGLNLVAPVKVKVKKVENQITCPHCDKTGGATGMRIHHFDRCKLKKK